MDYILTKLDSRITIAEAMGHKDELLTYFRAKVEYSLLFSLGYLWNKNLDKLDEESKQYVIENYQRPTIGSILSLCRILDIEKEIFTKKFSKVVNDYPEIRNDALGHGFIFSDDIDTWLGKFRKLASEIIESSPFLLKKYDLVLVTSSQNAIYSGINYKAENSSILPWSCSSGICSFQPPSLYGLLQPNDYFRLSPFICATANEEFLIYRDLQEALTGRARYNMLFHTKSLSLNWQEFFSLVISEDSNRIKGQNGTIINRFARNYKKFIDISIKNKLLKFVKQDKSSVCATLWGHGGVGKTASAQSICDDLIVAQKHFDYIVFLSAKDRYYDYYTGEIEEIAEAERITSFDSFVRNINTVVFNQDNSNKQLILESDVKLLMIIDDYETFSQSDRQQIEDFIKELDVNRHKVLITTRANVIVGQEIPTNELDPVESVKFLKEYLTEELKGQNIGWLLAKLKAEEIQGKVHLLSQGRPLFLIQFAHLWVQLGSIDEALAKDIGSSKSAVDFLYGRLYDYLQQDAKDAFVATSLLVSELDLTNHLSKLRYLINLENEASRFDAAVKELNKLKIIELLENQFFRVYSVEIFSQMQTYYKSARDSLKRMCSSRIKLLTANKADDIDISLLRAANTIKISASEEEVTTAFRHVLNRASCRPEIRRDAIIGLAEYYWNFKFKRDEAVQILRQYYVSFRTDPKYVRFYSWYTWDAGERDTSLDVLNNYLSTHADISNPVNLDLRATFLSLKSSRAIELKERAKQRMRYGELDVQEFQRLAEKQKQEFFFIYNKIGLPFFEHVQKNLSKLLSLKAPVRQNIVSALGSLVEVCIRLNNWETAKEICSWAISSFSSHSSQTFRQLRAKVERFESRG